MHRAPATFSILVFLLLVSLVLNILSVAAPEMHETWSRVLSNHPTIIRHKLWLWQFVTASFVHPSIIHGVTNIVLLFIFLRSIEWSIGSRLALTFFVLSGIFSYATYFASHVWWFEAWETTTGASGSVYAAAVLAVLMRPKWSVEITSQVKIPVWVVVLFLVLMDLAWFLWPYTMPWINRVCHLGGVAFAVLWWLCFGPRDVSDSSKGRFGAVKRSSG